MYCGNTALCIASRGKKKSLYHEFESGHFLRESYWWGKFIGIDYDLCSKLQSKLGDGGSRPKKGGVLGEVWREQLAPSPPAMDLRSDAVSSPDRVRGKAPAAVDFEVFGPLFSLKTGTLEPSLLSVSGGTDVLVFLYYVC